MDTHTKKNTFLHQYYACQRTIREHKKRAHNGVTKINVYKRLYRARCTLHKCPGKNSNERVFAQGDIVEIICTDAEYVSKKHKVWIIAYKSRPRNPLNHVKLWARPLDEVLKCCEEMPFEERVEQYDVVDQCLVNNDPKSRGDDNYVLCYAIEIQGCGQLWIEKGIFPEEGNNNNNDFYETPDDDNDDDSDNDDNINVSSNSNSNNNNSIITTTNNNNSFNSLVSPYSFTQNGQIVQNVNQPGAYPQVYFDANRQCLYQCQPPLYVPCNISSELYYCFVPPPGLE